MKKFLNIFLLLGISASAYALPSRITAPVLPEPKQIVAAESASVPRHAPKAVKQGQFPTQKELYGEYEMKYSDLLSTTTTSVSCYATLREDEFGYVELVVPEIEWAFTAEYDAETGSLIFRQMRYFDFGDGTLLYQSPLRDQQVSDTTRAVLNTETNSFEFAPGDGLAFVRVIKSTGQSAGYYWALDHITLVRPKFDYRMSIDVDVECDPSNMFIYTVNTGNDIASLKCLQLQGDWACKEVTDLFDMLGVEITPGSPILLAPESTVSETTPYSILVAGYNADGEMVRTVSKGVIIILDEDDAWTTIAHVPFTDQLVTNYYNNFSYTTQDLEIQEKINSKGLFRLKNPYKGRPEIHADGCNHYIYLDQRDPEFVDIPFSPTGISIGDGILCIGGYAVLGATKEECLANGDAVATMDGRTVKFKAGTIFAHEEGYNGPGNWSYMNQGWDYNFEMPALTLTVKTPAPGITVTVGGVTATSGSDGNALLELPAPTDYLDTVTMTVSNGTTTATSEVKLHGASNVVVVDDDLAATLSGVTVDGSVPVYYDLRGMRLDKATPGTPVIKVTGTKTEKVIL